MATDEERGMIGPRPDVVLMEGYHSPQVDVPVRLNTNEAPEPPPAAWVREVTAAVADIDWNRYPDRGATGLRKKLADLHSVDPAQVFVANGSNEVLQTLLVAYGGPGRSAAVFEPTYALHSHIARLTATDVVVGERNERFELDPDELERVLDETEPAVTFLCSPNNPTGMVEADEVIEAAVEDAPGLVVVDEAYGQFAPRSALDRVTADGPLVVTRTYSKTWAMAGARLGYCIGSVDVVEQLWKVVLPYHLDSFKQIAGTLALDHVDEMEARVSRLVEERGRLVAALTELDVQVWPSGANFVLFRPTARDGEEVWQQLLDAGVLVRNCATWPRLAGCLRVTIGTPDEDDSFLDALRRILA
jgi:histidinol-phosphate aminotransferase